MIRCTKPQPPGYAQCTREDGHDGPCAVPLAIEDALWRGRRVGDMNRVELLTMIQKFVDRTRA